MESVNKFIDPKAPSLGGYSDRRKLAAQRAAAGVKAKAAAAKAKAEAAAKVAAAEIEEEQKEVLLSPKELLKTQGWVEGMKLPKNFVTSKPDRGATWAGASKPIAGSVLSVAEASALEERQAGKKAKAMSQEKIGYEDLDSDQFGGGRKKSHKSRGKKSRRKKSRKSKRRKRHSKKKKTYKRRR